MPPPCAAQSSSWSADYTRLLGKYTTANGVKYADWKSNAGDMQSLQTIVDAIAQENVSSLGQNDQLAFYVNAYNAWILHEALAKYPTGSVKDTLFTFFTGKRIKVAGQQTSFNALEKETIARSLATHGFTLRSIARAAVVRHSSRKPSPAISWTGNLRSWPRPL